MMSKRNKEKNYVEEMKKNFTDNDSVMIAQYQGLNVNELDALRKELREKGILFKITKNRVTKIALKETSKKRFRKIFYWSNRRSYFFRSYLFCKDFNKIFKVER